MAAGSAIASCSTLFVAAAAQLFISVRMFRLKTSGRILLKFLLFVLSIPALLYLEQYLPYGWLTRMVLVGSTITLLSVSIGLIKPRQLLSILQKQT
jgi:hypothetical protein